MDTVSNGGFLQFSAGGILSPLPGELARDYGPCDYDIRHNLNAQYVYQLPIKIRNHQLAHALNGWQISGTMFWHSGVPFSVLSTPYSANGNGIVQGSGPQFASVVPGVPLYAHHPVPGVTQPGTIPVVESRRLCCRLLIRVQGSAPVATTRSIANSETSAAMPCAVLISSGMTSISRNGFR